MTRATASLECLGYAVCEPSVGTWRFGPETAGDDRENCHLTGVTTPTVGAATTDQFDIAEASKAAPFGELP
jgi:hypothetical protein